jgi:signal transduction histidine kinase
MQHSLEPGRPPAPTPATSGSKLPEQNAAPRRTLRWRLTIAALLPLLLAMTAAWAIATLIFTHALEQRVADQLVDTADVLTRSGLPLTPELLQRVADLQRASITLLDAEGRSLLSTSNRAADHSGPAAPDPMAIDASFDRPKRLDIDGEPLIAITRPVSGPSNSQAATLLITASLRDARDAARRAALGMGLAVLAAAALLVALQYLLLRGITRPIERLVNLANGIAAGRRDMQAGSMPHGELQALASALDDMTSRLQTYEDELAERSRLTALGEMAARLAHEVRNPLTGLKLHLQLLDERAAAADRPAIKRLLEEVDRLELIVTSTLSLTRPSKAALRPGDVGVVVDEVLQIMEPSLHHRGIELRRDVADVPRLPIDRDRLKQAVLNLIVNAADALPDGGVILANCRHDRERAIVRLCIEDSGPGLAQAPGTGEAASSAKPFGLGLGLKLCREIVAEHGGSLQLGGSEALGGACAAIELPVRTDT